MNERRFSARKALYMGFMTMIVMGGGLLGWSVFASLSGAVIASGRLGVKNRNQVVEHIDGGTVSRIFVRDGDSVKKNDVLLRFDVSLLRSEEAIFASEYAELVARRNRLEAELEGADTIVWEENIAALSGSDLRVRSILDGHERLFRARLASRNGEVAQLRERIGQARKEIDGLEARAVSLVEQRELIFRQLKAYRELFDKGLTSLDRLLALERAAKNLEGLVGTNAASIAGAWGRISELGDSDTPGRRAADRGGGAVGPRGEVPGEPDSRTPRNGARASQSHGGPRAGFRQGVRHEGGRSARGRASGRADPLRRAGGFGPGGDGAPQSDSRGSGIYGTGGAGFGFPPFPRA